MQEVDHHVYEDDLLFRDLYPLLSNEGKRRRRICVLRGCDAEVRSFLRGTVPCAELSLPTLLSERDPCDAMKMHVRTYGELLALSRQQVERGVALVDVTAAGAATCRAPRPGRFCTWPIAPT